ncbi:glycosyltransferase [Candidatus Parcubacteria bacterium]|nr:MAG: glycosyltransferase [Candidatus Parcubacteria bacterium]
MEVNESFPLVSIRIPAYNHAAFIEQCLDSVLSDNYPNKELLIMDDGSTDDTVSIVERWIETNSPGFPVRLYKRPHRGLCAVLNELIPLCKGEYLVSLASDDILLPDGIKSRVDYLKKNPDKSAVIGDCIVIDAKGNKIYESALSDMNGVMVESYLDDEGLRKEIVWQWSVPGPVLMVRRSIYERIGGYDERLAFEDWDFYLRMASKNLLGFVNQKVSGYRIHHQNTCRSIRRGRAWFELSKAGFRNLSRFKGKLRWLLFKRSVLSLLLSVRAWANGS